jgi:hypothetical protein
MMIFAASLICFAVSMTLMAVGLLLRGRRIEGGCGSACRCRDGEDPR